MTSHDGSLSCEQQLVGDVEVTGVGEHRQQVRRGQEAGAEVGVGLADQLDQPVGDRRPQLVGHQVERQRAHVVGLRVRGEPARRRRGTPPATRPARARASSAYRAASSARPSTAAIRAIRPALWAKYAVATSPLSAATKAPKSADLLARAPATRPSGSRCPRGTARAAPARATARPGRGAAGRGPSARPGPARRTIVGHSSSRTCDVAVGAVQLPRHDDRGVAPAGRAVQEG